MKERGNVIFDNDTCTSVGSYEAALRAAGSVCAAIDTIMAEKAKNAFCAIRPPGHHAEYSHAMGFCFFTVFLLNVWLINSLRSCYLISLG